MIGEIQEKHDKYAHHTFEMSSLHPKYTVKRFPIVLGIVGADQENGRILHHEHSPFGTLGNAVGCSVWESSYSPESSSWVSTWQLSGLRVGSLN